MPSRKNKVIKYVLLSFFVLLLDLKLCKSFSKLELEMGLVFETIYFVAVVAAVAAVQKEWDREVPVEPLPHITAFQELLPRPP